MADTARVLSAIDAAVSEAAALSLQVRVDRLLESAAPSIWGDESDDGLEVAIEICDELGVDWLDHLVDETHDRDCACGVHLEAWVDGEAGVFWSRQDGTVVKVLLAPDAPVYLAAPGRSVGSLEQRGGGC